MSFGVIAGLATAAFGLLGSDANADAAEDQARREGERTKLELQIFRRDEQALRGRQKLDFIAAGVYSTTGTAADIIADDIRQADLDAKLIEAGGEARVSRAESAADRAELEGLGVFTGGLLGAAAEAMRE